MAANRPPGSIYRREDFDEEEWQSLQSKLRRCAQWAHNAAAIIKSSPEAAAELRADIERSSLSSASSRQSQHGSGHNLTGSQSPDTLNRMPSITKLSGMTEGSGAASSGLPLSGRRHVGGKSEWSQQTQGDSSTGPDSIGGSSRHGDLQVSGSQGMHVARRHSQFTDNTGSSGGNGIGGLSGPSPAMRSSNSQRFSITAWAKRAAEKGGDVSVHGMQEIINIMQNGTPDQRLRATMALTNVLPDSDSNRMNAHAAGAIGVLVQLMMGLQTDKRLARLAVACLSNLSAEAALKDPIALSGAIPLLVQHLDDSGSKDGKAAAAHAAATLWSVCIDMPHIKQQVATKEILSALVKLLVSKEPTVRTQACGCVGELCVGSDQNIKDLLCQIGVIPLLVQCLGRVEHELQHLASCAICNLVANNPQNKEETRRCGAVDIFCKLIVDSERVEHVREAAAGGLYNVVTTADREIVAKSGALEVLQKYPAPHSKLIMQRLIGRTNSSKPQNKGEVNGDSHGPGVMDM